MLDAWSRRIVGWSIAHHRRADRAVLAELSLLLVQCHFFMFLDLMVSLDMRRLNHTVPSGLSGCVSKHLRIWRSGSRLTPPSSSLTEYRATIC